MRTIKFILQKEFKQIFRNKGMLPIIFLLPVIQLIVLSNAATYEIKELKIHIIDKDQSTFSRKLISKFKGSNYFKISDYSTESNSGKKALMSNKTDILLKIPQNFENQLFRENQENVQLIINAIDGSKAGIGMGYATNIIQRFNQEIIEKNSVKTGVILKLKNIKNINVTHANWYNPQLDYKTFMVPGILVLLITMIGVFLSSMNIVREKEIGTIEQLNVTPIKKYQFIIGKLLPFLIIGLFELAVGLLVAKFVFNTPFIGSIAIIFLFAIVYLLVVLGMGLLISTITDTQQQAMFISWFFLVIFILLSGLFTAIENMPVWAQKITLLNPVRYFIEVTRMVMLKGAGFLEIKSHFIILIVYAFFMNGLAVFRYRKTSG